MRLDILAIGPHPDDVEMGMGGAILNFVADGLKVGILDLTNGEPTPMGTPERRALESQEAARLLGVARRTMQLPNRYLEDTVEARTAISEVLRECRPRILFVPYWEDAHPDHLAARRLAEAARFYAKLSKTASRLEPWYPQRVIHYVCSHLRLHVVPSFIIDIGPYIEKKLQAVRAYESQFNATRGNLDVIDRLRVHAEYWGSLIGTAAGEPFITQEPVGLRSLRGVVL